MKTAKAAFILLCCLTLLLGLFLAYVVHRLNVKSDNIIGMLSAFDDQYLERAREDIHSIKLMIESGEDNWSETEGLCEQ